MKTNRIPKIAKLWLILILALALVPYVAVAKDTATLDEQLIEAANRGDLTLVKSLMDKGADINAQDRDGFTLLMLAARAGNLDLAKYLVGKGLDVNAKTPGSGTVLMFAARAGNLDLVEYLIDQGADVNANDGGPGWTALIVAVEKDRLGITRLLSTTKGSSLLLTKGSSLLLTHITYRDTAGSCHGHYAFNIRTLGTI